MRIMKFTILLRSSELGKNTAWKSKEYNNFVLCQSGILLHVLLNVICLNQNNNPIIHNKKKTILLVVYLRLKVRNLRLGVRTFELHPWCPFVKLGVRKLEVGCEAAYVALVKLKQRDKTSNWRDFWKFWFWELSMALWGIGKFSLVLYGFYKD